MKSARLISACLPSWMRAMVGLAPSRDGEAHCLSPRIRGMLRCDVFAPDWHLTSVAHVSGSELSSRSGRVLYMFLCLTYKRSASKNVALRIIPSTRARPQRPSHRGRAGRLYLLTGVYGRDPLVRHREPEWDAPVSIHALVRGRLGHRLTPDFPDGCVRH